MTETQVNNAQAGTELNVPAADGLQNGSQGVADLKDILGPVFGTTFKTDEDALKSVEHAKNMAGKVGQLEKQLADITQMTNNPELEQKFNQLEQTVKQNNFFSQNPEYNTPEVKSLIADMGGNPEEVVQKDSFKNAFTAIKARNEMDSSKSVLHTNPRLGTVQDNMTRASDALKTNNDVEARNLATAAVLEAFPAK